MMTLRRPAVTVVSVAMLSALTACSDNDKSTSEDSISAAIVVRDIAARVNFAKPTIIFGAEDDPNGLLGRPGGYTSKGSFDDSRLTKNKDINSINTGEVERGGSVEVYPEDDQAIDRATYIQQSLRNNPILGTEYTYVAGGTVLRLSGKLTPAQTPGYVKALEQSTQHSVNGPIGP